MESKHTPEAIAHLKTLYSGDYVEERIASGSYSYEWYKIMTAFDSGRADLLKERDTLKKENEQMEKDLNLLFNASRDFYNQFNIALLSTAESRKKGLELHNILLAFSTESKDGE